MPIYRQDLTLKPLQPFIMGKNSLSCMNGLSELNPPHIFVMVERGKNF